MKKQRRKQDDHDRKREMQSRRQPRIHIIIRREQQHRGDGVQYRKRQYLQELPPRHPERRIAPKDKHRQQENAPEEKPPQRGHIGVAAMLRGNLREKRHQAEQDGARNDAKLPDARPIVRRRVHGFTSGTASEKCTTSSV